MYWNKRIRFLITIIKEMVFVVFTKDSRIAQSYAILILAGEMTIDDVPNVGNLRAVVLEILGAQPTEPGADA